MEVPVFRFTSSQLITVKMVYELNGLKIGSFLSSYRNRSAFLCHTHTHTQQRQIKFSRNGEKRNLTIEWIGRWKQVNKWIYYWYLLANLNNELLVLVFSIWIFNIQQFINYSQFGKYIPFCHVCVCVCHTIFMGHSWTGKWFHRCSKNILFDYYKFICISVGFCAACIDHQLFIFGIRNEHEIGVIDENKISIAKLFST